MSIRNWIKELQIIWKYGSDPAQRAYKTRQKLPYGDPIREEAQRLCDKEYEASFAQENNFTLKYGWRNYKKIVTLQDATNFANYLCSVAGAKPIKEVLLCEPGKECYGAYYTRRKKSIYVRLPVSIVIMVHETSHHIADTEHFLPPPESHGKEFLEIEQKLFDHLLNH
jgi:hypothetical protein